MSLLAGTVTVSVDPTTGAATFSGSGLALLIAQRQLAAVEGNPDFGPWPAPNGNATLLKSRKAYLAQLVAGAGALASAIVDHFTANAVVTVSGTASSVTAGSGTAPVAGTGTVS